MIARLKGWLRRLWSARGRADNGARRPERCACIVCECERAARMTALASPNAHAIIVTPARGLVLLGSAQRKDDVIKENCVLLTPAQARQLATKLGATADEAERLATPEGVN